MDNPFNSKLINELRPKNWGEVTAEIEPFPNYQDRISKILPNWPACPLENWLYRHFDFVISDYGWLNFRALVFTKTVWKKYDIYTNINSHIIYSIDNLGKQIFTNSPSMRSWLQEYMIKNNTWPVPIILLNNIQGIMGPENEKYGKPFHLLEGHLRLGYFRNIYKRDKNLLKDSHSVWIVDI